MTTPAAWDAPTVEFGTKDGRQLRITRTTPTITGSRVIHDLAGDTGLVVGHPGTGWYIPSPTPTKPTKVTGVVWSWNGEPARFEVDGLAVAVTFTLAPTDDGTFTITELVVKPRDGGRLVQQDVDRIPVASLVKHGLTAAGVLGTYFPAGYDGPYVDMWNGLTITTMRITTDSGAVHENGSRRLTDNEVIRLDVEGMTKARRRNAMTRDELQRVADVWHDAKQRGTSTEQAVVELGWTRDLRTARRWITKAREAGLIPPIPDSDKRKART